MSDDKAAPEFGVVGKIIDRILRPESDTVALAGVKALRRKMNGCTGTELIALAKDSADQRSAISNKLAQPWLSTIKKLENANALVAKLENRLQRRDAEIAKVRSTLRIVQSENKRLNRHIDSRNGIETDAKTAGNGENSESPANAPISFVTFETACVNLIGSRRGSWIKHYADVANITLSVVEKWQAWDRVPRWRFNELAKLPLRRQRHGSSWTDEERAFLRSMLDDKGRAELNHAELAKVLSAKLDRYVTPRSIDFQIRALRRACTAT